jgi:predicted nucleic acid-binding protein
VKLLIDSCVWSLVLRRKPAATLSSEEQQMASSLTEAIRDGRTAIIGPIRQEILSGIKEVAQFEKLRSTLQSFPDEPLVTSDYEEAARLFNLCRSKGIQCGPVDILLCAVAQKRQWVILTFDQSLKSCMEVVMGDRIRESRPE